jgi:hypothetical protein
MYLSKYENQTFSQNGEDGVIKAIFDTIKTTNKLYVEFGVENGNQCNTRLLREKYDWSGLSMDGGYSNPKRGLHKEFITRENILKLFLKYKIPKTFDLLSVDIDYNDLYVLQEILTKHNPRVIVSEFNGQLDGDSDQIVIYDPMYMWDRTNYANASFKSYKQLLDDNNYTIVYVEKMGVNLFAVQNKYANLFANAGKMSLFKPAAYIIGTHVGHKADHLQRPYVTYKQIKKYNIRFNINTRELIYDLINNSEHSKHIKQKLHDYRLNFKGKKWREVDILRSEIYENISDVITPLIVEKVKLNKYYKTVLHVLLLNTIK